MKYKTFLKSEKSFSNRVTWSVQALNIQYYLLSQLADLFDVTVKLRWEDVHGERRPYYIHVNVEEVLKQFPREQITKYLFSKCTVLRSAVNRLLIRDHGGKNVEYRLEHN